MSTDERQKLTIISPSWYHYRYAAGRAYPKEVYKNDEEYFADVAKAYQVELGLLYDMGIKNVQVDDPNLGKRSCKRSRGGWLTPNSLLLLGGNAQGMARGQEERQDRR